MKKTELARLNEMCCNIWPALSEDEKEAYYCTEGTIEFVNDIANIIHVDFETITDEELDGILDAIDDLEDADEAEDVE